MQVKSGGTRFGFLGLGKEIKHGLARHSTPRPIPQLRSSCRNLCSAGPVGVDSVDSGHSVGIWDRLHILVGTRECCFSKGETVEHYSCAQCTVGRGLLRQLAKNSHSDQQWYSSQKRSVFFFPCLVLTGLEHLIQLWSQWVCNRAVVVLDHLHLDLC